MPTLEDLRFKNSFAGLPDASRPVLPTPLEDCHLVSFNAAAAELIDLDPAEAQRPEFLDFFSGRRVPPDSEPLAMLYAGHQFGVYVPQLGDGRAILLGEVSNNRGERWELQLKGSGLTPFSRQGDGRAVLRSTVREYLCSEAMHGLGIPTTRALCIVGSEEEVYRETVETGAMLLRMAPSHVRFGSFEVFFYRDQSDHIGRLADYVIEHHFPHLVSDADKYGRLLDEVTESTARLIAKWQAVGFTHGVMNTDNMSILGLTLDYGPFGFMDAYKPRFVCNHSDYSGRYAFDKQPRIGSWNLTCLAQALTPLMSVDRAKEALQQYGPAFARHFAELMNAKLGIGNHNERSAALVDELLEIMAANRVDYTRFFRALGSFKRDGENTQLRDMFLDRAAFDAWSKVYGRNLAAENSDDDARKAAMDRVNPKYVLRNYLAQQAIERATAERDYSEIDRLLRLLQNPFDEQPDMEAYAAEPPDWAASIEVSCSS